MTAIYVEVRRVSLTTSDAHLRHLRFFQDMLSRFALVWTGPYTNQIAGLAGGAPFYTAAAVFGTDTDAVVVAYLDHLGSRLVFLIDWNRARKQLRGFLERDARLALLRWAADHDIGHRGFLQLGGAGLIWDVADTTAASAIRLGDRLSDVLGAEAKFAFGQFVFITAGEGLRARQSDNLIRERIRAELFFHLHSAETRLLSVASDHAGLVFELATALRDHITAGLDDAADPKDLERWVMFLKSDSALSDSAPSAPAHFDLALSGIGIFVILPGESLLEGGGAAVGNKTWNLLRMAQQGMSVPAGFVLPTH